MAAEKIVDLSIRTQAWVKKHHHILDVSAFIVGFIFDILTLGRIDSMFGIIQQAVYLSLITFFLYQMTRVDAQKLTETKTRWPQLRLWLVHFFFGNLLSTYTLFYFKSASHLSAILFLFFLSGILVMNELTRFRSLDLRFKWMLLSLCIVSYFSYLVPLVVRHMGVLPFLGAILCSIAIVFLLRWILIKKNWDQTYIKKNIIIPWVSMTALFCGLYFLRVLPPVPVSLKYIGIYRDVKKEEGTYALTYLKSWWRVWQSGDQTFQMRPGDKIYCFFQIFSPTDFKDEVTVQWYLKDKRQGWIKSDHVPVKIVGGREEGFRGFTYKSLIQPGKWRVSIESSDGREIGRINVDVIQDTTESVRDYKIKKV